MSILIVRFSSLGDVVMTSAVVEALYRRFPDVRLTVLTKNVYTPLYASDERVAETIGIKGNEDPFDILRLLAPVSFDTVVDLHASLRSRLITAFLRSPGKLTVKKHSTARRLMVLSRNRLRRRYDVLGSYLDTIKPLDVTGRVLPKLVPAKTADEEAGGIIGDMDGDVVGFAPGARHDTKRWNENSFARAADETVKRGYVPVFIGDAVDVPVVERIRRNMSGKSVSLAGRIDLDVTVAAIARMRCLVTNDSGPMHIAGALGVPFVAVFGPTHPDLGFVPGYPSGHILHSGAFCSPCSVHGARPCRMKRRFCMDDITWEMVIRELDSFPEPEDSRD